MWNLSFRVQTFCFPVRMPYKPGWLFCLWGTVRQQSQCTSGGKKARGPRRQKRFVCDGASKQQGRILSFDQATYLVSKRDQTSNFQRIKKKRVPMPFLNARGFTCVVNRPWSPGPVFSPSRLAKVRCSSWLFDGSPGKRAVVEAGRKVLNSARPMFGKLPWGNYRARKGLHHSAPLFSYVEERTIKLRRNRSRASSMQGNVISHGGIRGISG